MGNDSNNNARGGYAKVDPTQLPAEHSDSGPSGGFVPAPRPASDRSGPIHPFADSSFDERASPVVLTSRRGSSLPWVLSGVMAVGLGVAGVQYLLPWHRELAKLRTEIGEVNATNATLKKQVDDLGQARADLEATRGELSAQLAQRQAELDELQRTQEELANKLDAEIKKGEIAISSLRGQLIVDVADKILFTSGEAELNDQGKEVLRRVGDTLLKVKDKAIQIGGHTDAVPISPKLIARFATNWELSATRATNVVRFLQDEVKVPGERLVAAGFSQYRPVASNAKPSGRHRNRRIELMLVSIDRR